MNYALGYAWKLDEIFMNFKSQNLIIDGVSLQRLYGDNHKKRLCYKVFRECVKLIVNDIIDNDVEFQLPTGSRKTSLQMHTYRDEEFKKAISSKASKIFSPVLADPSKYLHPILSERDSASSF